MPGTTTPPPATAEVVIASDRTARGSEPCTYAGTDRTERGRQHEHRNALSAWRTVSGQAERREGPCAPVVLLAAVQRPSREERLLTAVRTVQRPVHVQTRAPPPRAVRPWPRPGQ